MHFSLSIHCPALVRQDPWSVRLESVEIEICVYYTEQLEQADKVQANSNKACNLIWWQWAVENIFTLITN